MAAQRILWEFLIVCISCGTALSQSSLCYLEKTSDQTQYQSGTVFNLDADQLASSVEWYNVPEILTIHTRIRINITSDGGYVGINLSPCWSKSWNFVISQQNIVEVFYYSKSYGSRKFDTYQTIDDAIVNDGQYHDLLLVVDRVSNDALRFNASIDDPQYISFLFEYGMEDREGNAVNDSHVMALNEFGYSRTITIDGEDAEIQIKSFSVSGDPSYTGRSRDCWNPETYSGQSPPANQPVEPCDPIVTSTEFISSTNDEDPDKDNEADVASNGRRSNTSAFWSVMFVFMGVIICLCIVLFGICFYFKKKQDKIQRDIDMVKPTEEHREVRQTVQVNSLESGNPGQVNELDANVASDRDMVEGANPNNPAVEEGAITGDSNVQRDEFVVRDEEEDMQTNGTLPNDIGVLGGEVENHENEVEGQQ